MKYYPLLPSPLKGEGGEGETLEESVYRWLIAHCSQLLWKIIADFGEELKNLRLVGFRCLDLIDGCIK